MNGDYKDDIVGINATSMRIHYQGSTPGNFTVTDHTFSFSGSTSAALVPNWSMAKTLISLVARKKTREVTSANVKNALRICCGYSINESTLSEAISLCNSHGASNGNCWFDHVNDLTDQHRKLKLDL